LKHSLHEGAVGRAALGAITLMGALVVIEPQVAVQVRLQLVERCVERFAEGPLEELFLYRVVEPVPGPVAFRRSVGGTLQRKRSAETEAGSAARPRDVLDVLGQG
jgi:hypothetical protein